MTTLELLFWIFAFIVFYTYLGYGILVTILVKIKELFKRPSKVKTRDDKLPKVTLLIAAYNEEDIIQQKMENNYSLDYPSELFEICWVSDGSTDRTNELLEPYLLDKDVNKPKVTLIFKPERGGKTAALNHAMKLIKSPIVVFTDANTMLNPQAISEIVKQFSNPKVGCVAGEKRVTIGTGSGAASSEGIYWKYESFLKNMDWRLYSTVGAAGELYAIRSNLFRPLPQDTLLDDFVLSMKIAEEGYRIAYCPTAYAQEDGSLNMKEEEKRKIRISAGGLQSIARLLPLFNCFKYPVLSFQYVSHRVLRWSITPILLFALLPINFFLIFIPGREILYSAILAAQILFYILAMVGTYLAGKQIKNIFFYIPYYFLFMNINVFRGAFYLYNKKNNDGTWEKSLRK